MPASPAHGQSLVFFGESSELHMGGETESHETGIQSLPRPEVPLSEQPSEGPGIYHREVAGWPSE